MVEMMIVIAIIAILILLTLKARDTWKGTARRQTTATAMASLRSAAKIYRQVVPAPLQDSDAANYYYANPGTGGVKIRALTPMEYFIFKTSGVPACQAQLDRVPATMLAPEQAALVEIWKSGTPNVLMQVNYTLKTVKDPWNIELKYRSTSLAATETDPAIPSSPDASDIFASSGPDTLWGTLENHNASLPDDDATDNIYFNQ